MIKFVIFDVMGVIFTVSDDVEDLLIPYIRSLKPEIDAQSVKDAYLTTSLGKIPSVKFWMLMGFKLSDAHEIEREYLEKSFSLDADFLPCAYALKSRYSLAMLSNDISEWNKYLRGFYAIEPLLNAAFISGDLGVRKPDPKIYQLALSGLGAKPSECLFIDDMPDRVDAARELGISSILFNRKRHDYRGIHISTFEQLTQMLL